MRTVVVGSNGQLGSDVTRAFVDAGCEVYGVNHSEIEIADIDSVRGGLNAFRPAVVVNTAAMHNVEECERQPERAMAVNGEGAKNLAVTCRELGALLIHVSTDYVFDGVKKSPYVEDDAPNPLNTYGRSKLIGEQHVREIADRHFVVRASALYGKSPCRAKGLNFVELMLKLGRERDEVRVVDHEVVSPTTTLDLARHLVLLARSEAYGLYHATAEGSCSWYAFAREIFSAAGVKTRLAVAAPGEFPGKVPRPAYSVLENAGLKTQRLNSFKTWQEGLHEYLAEVHVA